MYMERMFYTWIICEDVMVVSYLEKNREKLQENRIHINGLLNAANNEYRENTEFIKLLEENNDPNFESFTPRQVNGFNKRKINELQDSQKELEIRIEELKVKLQEVDDELEEIGNVIRVAKEQKRLVDNM